jgi:SAM-dependent methyltransferase
MDRPSGESFAAPVAAPSGDLRLGLGLALLSTVLLSYEVVQLRVFAYSASPAFVYAAIAIAMLGLGVASTVLSLSKRLQRLPLGTLLAAGCIGFAASGLLANMVFARMSDGIYAASDLSGTFTAVAAVVVLLSMLPYACGGLAVAAVLSRRSEAVGRLYAFNLLGSGVGCFAVQLLLRPLGAERLVLLLLAFGAAAAWLLAGRERAAWRRAALGVAAALAIAAPFGTVLLPYRPDSRDQLALAVEAYHRRGLPDPVREFAAWDPVGRIEIHSWFGQPMRVPDPIPFKLFTQDAGAASVLLGLGVAPGADARIFDDTVYGVAHQLRPGSDVLLIGLGGGPDVQAALRHGARSVTGVEINRAAVDLVGGRFSRFVGDVYHAPNVDIVVQDGRSFVRAAERRWDLLQMSGTDTLTVQSSGSFVMAESYLYTVEAFEDYLRVLRPNGVLAVLRFGLEPYRLVGIASRALRRAGVEHPERNIVVLGQTLMKLTLVKRVPWTDEELREIERIVARSASSNAGIEFVPYDSCGVRLGAPLGPLYLPGRSGNDPLVLRVLAQDAGGSREPVAVIPTDDRPFYFAWEVLGYLAGTAVAPAAAAQVRSYLQFLRVLVVVALVLIVVPLVVLRRSGLRGARSLAALAYFFLLGLSYMLVEVCLLQQTALVVEHPAYSVSIVLGALLLSSALGSRLSGRGDWPPRRMVATAVLGVVLCGAILVLWGKPLFDALLSLPFAVRMVGVAAAIAPLGMAMGMLFPLGLRLVGPAGAAPASWAIGVNGFASVLGSSLALPLAVVLGFTQLLGVAVLAYILAGLAFFGLGRATPTDSGNAAA